MDRMYHEQCLAAMRSEPSVCMLAGCATHGRYGAQEGMCPQCARDAGLCRWCKKALSSPADGNQHSKITQSPPRADGGAAS
mmetsp:Transcript_16882/g.51086  ORF Transcript_16882/g.51086 Transcript_16882/m.51086 type:complete len:81 (+) Transcript_16882:62-304(+)|eukprot:scaffold123509_cov33-Tisochrysis_lutea.AAC.2